MKNEGYYGKTARLSITRHCLQYFSFLLYSFITFFSAPIAIGNTSFQNPHPLTHPSPTNHTHHLIYAIDTENMWLSLQYDM